MVLSQTHDLQQFSVSEKEADWHELMIQQQSGHVVQLATLSNKPHYRMPLPVGCSQH